MANRKEHKADPLLQTKYERDGKAQGFFWSRTHSFESAPDSWGPDAVYITLPQAEQPHFRSTFSYQKSWSIPVVKGFLLFAPQTPPKAACVVASAPPI